MMGVGSWGPSKMPDKINSNAIEAEVFAHVQGSQTSADGQRFALHARRDDDSGVMLVFPTRKFPTL